jgi:2-amino-4-hydroxy-6-hydroxymethyldihydropteridine diphosphokinase
MSVARAGCASESVAAPRVRRRTARRQAAYPGRTRVTRVARAFVGIGSNLGDRAGILKAAVERLGRTEGLEVVAVSRLRETDPVGIVDQPRFLNGAVELETSLEPEALLAVLLKIEAALGRDRAGVPRGGPRTIDLDLLLYGEQTVDEAGLLVPHPRLGERLFVLEPLAELVPTQKIPGNGTVAEALAGLQSGG